MKITFSLALCALLISLPGLSDTLSAAAKSSNSAHNLWFSIASVVPKFGATDDAEQAQKEHNIVKYIDFTKQGALSDSISSDAASIASPIEKSSAYRKAVTYRVAGKTYRTMNTTQAEDFQQKGKASWYGPRFHGRKTASGKRYDMYAMTAAHKRLPLGSKVKVTNLKNGKTVVVTINDRGPFHSKRIIDLSKAAARKIGLISQGVTNVSLTVLK